MRQENREFNKARDYAYKLLSYRQRSVQEIDQRLKKKGFEPGIIKEVIAYLSELDYLNDEHFANFWVRDKIQFKPVGRTLLRYQLKKKGISSQIIEKALSESTASYDEADAAKALALRRAARYRKIDPLKQKKRLYDYLLRRGFSQETILQALKHDGVASRE